MGKLESWPNQVSDLKSPKDVLCSTAKIVNTNELRWEANYKMSSYKLDLRNLELGVLTQDASCHPNFKRNLLNLIKMTIFLVIANSYIIKQNDIYHQKFIFTQSCSFCSNLHSVVSLNAFPHDEDLIALPIVTYLLKFNLN